jgi:hypothetical protein
MHGVIYVLVTLIAFLGTIALNYKSATKEEAVLILDQQCYHIHHWLMAVMAGLLVAGHSMARLPLRLFLAVLVGIALEGLLFKDWMRIKEDCTRAFTISPLAFTEGGMHTAR